jgi:hypothetical protein
VTKVTKMNQNIFIKGFGLFIKGFFGVKKMVKKPLFPKISLYSGLFEKTRKIKNIS